MAKTLNAKIASNVQKLAYGIRVELLDIDTSPVGDANGPYYICNGVTTSGQAVVFNSVTYNPLDYRFEGYEMSGEGRSSRPTIEVNNVSRTFAALVNTYDGLVGATITRRVTRSEYLDDGDDPDANAQMPTETYIINRVVEYNKYTIRWELTIPLDREDKKLPGRQAWKNFCPYIYRRWDSGTSAFNYDYVYECPYTGANYFDRDGGVVVSGAQDVCGKRLSDCRLRFSTTIPFGGFPGMADSRTR